MKELFVLYNIALLAKEKGFDEPCFGLFNPDKEFELLKNTKNIANAMNSLVRDVIIMAPLYQQLIMWLNEKLSIIDKPLINYDGFILITQQEMIKRIEEALKLIP